MIPKSGHRFWDKDHGQAKKHELWKIMLEE
jgi:hypothetical protein